MDFGRTYGIPADPDAALEVACAGRTRTIDVGRVSYRKPDGSDAESYFANVSSVGLSGAVAERANRTSKALGGKASFFLALVAAFVRWRNAEMTVVVDGETRTGKMTDVVVANGQYHGGAMWLAPNARPDDGLFDVLLIGDITKRDFVRNVGRIYRGTHLTHPKIDVVRSTAVAIDAADPMPIEVDGEQPGTTPARYEIVPRALKIRVPRG